MKKRGIPIAAVERAVREAEPEMRVSDSAKAELLREAERFSHDTAHKAGELAEHAGRKTIKDGDVRLAVNS